jgi:MFS family permease
MSWLNLSVYLWCLVGIVISAVLPSVWAYVRTHFPADPAQKSIAETYWTLAKPYLALCVASALTALLLVAFLGDTLVDPKAAILAGYAWDSTLQKLR